MRLFEGVAVNDFDGTISAHDAARQPDLTVAATANGTNQFVVGNLRKRMQSAGAGCCAVQRCLSSSGRKRVVAHRRASFSPLLPGNCLLTFLSFQQLAQYFSADPKHSFARGHVVFLQFQLPLNQPFRPRWITIHERVALFAQIFCSAPFLPLPATEEWGEERGEGLGHMSDAVHVT